MTLDSQLLIPLNISAQVTIYRKFFWLVRLTGSYNINLLWIYRSVDQNPYLCEPDQCNKKNSSIVTPLVASIGGVFILLVVVVAILWTVKRRKAKGDSTIVNIRYFYP